jgi:hypothetical protein
MKRLLLLALLTYLTVSVSAQKRQWRISDIYFSVGKQKEYNASFTLQDFQRSFPNSEILAKNYDTLDFPLTKKLFPLDYPTTSKLLSFQIGLKSRRFKNGIFRIGARNISNSTQFSTSGRVSKISGYDTLLINGNTIYLTFVKGKVLESQTSCNKFFLDISYTHSLPEERLMRMYAGIGLLVGLSYNSRVSVKYYERQGVSGNPNSFSSYLDQSEEFHLKSKFISTLYVPIGFDFKLAKKNDFWKLIHLFAEIRPAMTLQNVAKNETVFKLSSNSNVGIKFSF